MTAPVLIPTHKAELSRVEVDRVSHTARAVRGCHSLAFVVPRSLDISSYRLMWPFAEFHFFHDKHFSNARAYNRFMQSAVFYRRFVAHEHIIVCQTDALITKPLSASDYQFDYIGAPWSPPIKAGWNPVTRRVSSGRSAVGRRQLSVGNGGLSIRRVPAFLAAIPRLPKINATEHEDISISYFGARIGLNLAPAEVAARIFMESGARSWQPGAPIPDVHGFHALERFSPLLELEILAGPSRSTDSGPSASH